MEVLKLKMTQREVLGKKTRFLRRKGITPTHFFGRNIKSLTLECPTAELERTIAQAGTTRLINLHHDMDKQPITTIIREIQRHPISGQLLHVDFYQVRMEEKMTVDIPIVLIGEAPALKGRGRILTQPSTHLSIECLPHKLPSRIEVDISSLEEMNQAIRVSDIVLDPDVTITADPDQLVVKIGEVAAAKVEEEEKAEGEEAEAVEGAEAEAAEAAPEAETGEKPQS